MRHETSWKSRAVGAAAMPGRGAEAAGLRALRDRRDAENHPAKCLPLGPCLPATRREGPGRQTRAGSAVEAERPTETWLGQMPAEGSVGIRFWHGFVDVPARKAADRATLRRTLPCRPHPKAVSVVGFFPLRSPNAERLSGMKPLSGGGSDTTGPGSNGGRPGTRPTSYSSTRRAFCCIRLSTAPGPLAAAHRYCANEDATMGVSRQLEPCVFRPDAGTWAGTCSSTRTRRFARSRLSCFCDTCCVTCPTGWLWYGTGWAHTEAVCCGTGCRGVVGFAWSICRDTPQNSIPTNMGGPISKATRWPTTVQPTRINCRRRLALSPKRQPTNSLCSARSFMQQDCLSYYANEYYLYRRQ